MSVRSNVIAIFIVILVFISGFVGWRIGHSNKSANSSGTKDNPQTSTTNNNSGTSVKSLVSYTLPDGWSEGACPSSNSIIYISPNGTSLDCSANPSAPIKVFVDSQNTIDCQQLMPITNEGIRKHVCISLYISGHKSLKASTEYSNDSGYKTDTTISQYYVNTGKGVIAFQYTYTSDNEFQAGFDQLATSIKVK